MMRAVGRGGYDKKCRERGAMTRAVEVMGAMIRDAEEM